MKRFFVSIGSNIEPEKNVPACLGLLKENFLVKNISSVYETDPVGPAGDHPFWNLAVELASTLKEKDLTSGLRQIEAALGRKRGGNKFAPRPIDLDLLPQKDYQSQAFIMIPLAEIAPDTKDPETGKTFMELAGRIPQAAKGVRKLSI